ncbi:MAG: recombinase family protein [[Ruminococcus] torques]|jgi:DNA invertase Pin-like site-specific DNA recombinase
MHGGERKMVIPERKNQVAYYYRTTHRDHGYDKYMEPGREALFHCYGEIKKEEQFFWDEASGADGNRKRFRQLIENIQAGKIHVVVTRDAAMISRDWQQFFEFMEACDKAGTDVVSIDKEQDAWNQYIRVKEFVKEYFGRETVL